ncbi:MAG: hypothetical protein E2O35_09675 [Proteobacteria bacterium]|nr:MAG: hypothetical protein E2O35_09675 [Pseudomonadota bacterium]
MYRIWTIIVTLMFTTICLAGEDLFVCNATSVLELSDTGELEHTNYAKALGMHQSRFAVDRKTGIVAGGPFATVDATDGRILSSGTDTEALKIVWLTNAPYNHLKYLWVRAYAEGPKKPFLGVTGNIVVTGICE